MYTNKNNKNQKQIELSKELTSLQVFIKDLIKKQTENKMFTKNEETLFDLIQGFKMQFSKNIRIYGSEIVLNSKVEDDGNIYVDIDDQIVKISVNSSQGHQVVDFINLLSSFQKAIVSN